MKGKQEEIERIVTTYSSLLLRLVLHDTQSRSDAEDIVQETFLRYLRKAPDFKDEKHEKAWLIRVSSNLSKDVRRSWWHQKTMQLNEDSLLLEDKAKDTYSLLPYIRKLPRNCRHAIYLFYYEQYSVAMIASIYQVKENTVTSWLHRGRLRLKKIIEGVDFDDLG